jgi:hypothetical protein
VDNACRGACNAANEESKIVSMLRVLSQKVSGIQDPDSHQGEMFATVCGAAVLPGAVLPGTVFPSLLVPIQHPRAAHILCSESSALDAKAVASTRLWIKDVVIRLGLCPYAADVFNTAGKIRYAVSQSTSDQELIADFFTEAALLLDQPAEELATTMLVAPQYPNDIEGFYELYTWLTDLLEDDDEPILENQARP